MYREHVAEFRQVLKIKPLTEMRALEVCHSIEQFRDRWPVVYHQIMREEAARENCVLWRKRKIEK